MVKTVTQEMSERWLLLILQTSSPFSNGDMAIINDGSFRAGWAAFTGWNMRQKGLLIDWAGYDRS
jgi:hypothetical protein